MKLDFKSTSVEDILDLRHRVLRQGRPLSSAHFDGDSSSSSYHFAAFLDAKVVACVSLMQMSNPQFTNLSQYQLRGMAVDSDYRGQNIGQELLIYAENQLRLKQIDFLWCNVRVSAEIFYKKNGFQKTGEVFNIPEVGQHILMFKAL